MKNVLIAVDDSRGSETAVRTFIDLFSLKRPESLVLLYVQKIEGRSLMDEMLGEAEMSTLKEMIKGTEYQGFLDKKAERVIAHHTKILEESNVTGIKAVIREGHPAEEILKVGKEEGSDMIIIGSRGRRMHSFLLGSVSREVAGNAEVPVLLAK
jgi:nucleotide-binding universal stress UspA family protein